MTVKAIFTTIILVFVGSKVSAQTDSTFGIIKLKECNLSDWIIFNDLVYGQPICTEKVIVTAKSKVQILCNYGNPSKNEYSVVENKLAITCVYDSTGILKDSILDEIKRHLIEKEAWAIKYNGGELSGMDLKKSFYINNSIQLVVPFIWQGAENEGSYFVYYINSYMYKIELLEARGFGSLSKFISQNVNFTNSNGTIKFDKYVRNISEAYSLILKEGQ